MSIVEFVVGTLKMGNINTSATVPAPEASQCRRRNQRRILFVVAVVILGCGIAAANWWSWSDPRDNRRQPPTIPIDHLDQELRQAITDARERVLNHLDSARAWGELGMWYAHQDRSVEAVDCFVEAERLDPIDPHWPLYRAQTLERCGKPQEALISLRKAVALHTSASPYRTVANLRLAEALLEVSPAEAEDILQGELLFAPANPRAKYDLGLAVLARGDLQGAKEILSSLVDSPFARKKSLVKLALVARLENDEQSAANLEKRSREAPKDNVWANDPYEEEGANLVLIVRGNLAEVENLRRQGRIADANIAVVQLAQKDNTPHAWLMAGVHFLEVGNQEQAERCFRKSLQLDPDYVPTLYSLAYVFFRQGEASNRSKRQQALDLFRESERCSRHCIQVKPDHALGYLVLGRSLIFLDKNDDAVQQLHIAVKCRPDLADTHLYLAEALWLTGERDESRKEFRIARDLSNPQDLLQRSDLERISQAMDSKTK